jgi:hypothetical protein
MVTTSRIACALSVALIAITAAVTAQASTPPRSAAFSAPVEPAAPALARTRTPTPAKKPARKPTATPARKPARRPARTPVPTRTPAPSPTPLLMEEPPVEEPLPVDDPVAIPEEPPVGDPESILDAVWQRHQGRLGAPLPGNAPQGIHPAGSFAEMPFEGGHIFWTSVGDDRVWAVIGSGSDGWFGQGAWAEFRIDEFGGDPGPDYTCDGAGPHPPYGAIAWVWCNQEAVRQALGNGLGGVRDWDRESPGTNIYRLMEFEGGFIFRDSDGWTHNLVYVLFTDDQTFVRESE